MSGLSNLLRLVHQFNSNRCLILGMTTVIASKILPSSRVLLIKLINSCFIKLIQLFLSCLWNSWIIQYLYKCIFLRKLPITLADTPNGHCRWWRLRWWWLYRTKSTGNVWAKQTTSSFLVQRETIWAPTGSSWAHSTTFHTHNVLVVTMTWIIAVLPTTFTNILKNFSNQRIQRYFSTFSVDLA